MNPQILFRVDANSTIGWGHFYRSLALAQMLIPDFEIAFAIADPLPEIQKILGEEKFKLISLPALDYTNPDERDNNQFECDLHGHLYENDIVVTDGYWFREKYRSGLRKENVKIAVIEDDGYGSYDADLIINHAPGIQTSDYSVATQTRFALGPDYALLRPEFLAKAKETNSLTDKKEEVFICFGGADLDGLAFKTAGEVLENTGFKVNVIASAHHPRIAEAEKLNSRFPNRISLAANLSAAEMVNLMSESRFGIVPASGLLYECIACKLPVIAGYYAENQEKIYNGVREREVSIPTGNFNRSGCKTALEQIDDEMLDVIRENQAHLIDGYSDQRMVEIFKTIYDA